MVRHFVFLVHHECTHVKQEKQVSVWIRRMCWWKGGRQGEKCGRKRSGKKGKGKKSGFGKSPFCFCLTVFLPLPFFPCTHHTTTTQHDAHTHPSHTIQHDAFVHTITCKQGHVLCCLFGSGQRDTASSTPHTPSLDTTQHTPTNPTQTQLMVRATHGRQLPMRK